MKKNFKKFLILGLLSLIFCLPLFSEAWYIVVASFSKQSNAQVLVKELESKGYRADILKISVKGNPYYRVLIMDPSKTWNEAEVKQKAIAGDSNLQPLHLNKPWICRAEFKQVEEESEEVFQIVPVEDVPGNSERTELLKRINALEKKLEQSESEKEALSHELESVRENTVKKDTRKNLIQNGKAFVKENKNTTELPLPAEKEIMEEPEKKEVPLTENSDLTFSMENPYALLVHSYKEESVAEKDKNRLEKRGIPSYVVKLFDERESFSFDLMAGPAKSKEELNPIKTNLEEMGVTASQIVAYPDYKKKIDDYDSMISKETVYFDEGQFTLPDSYSEGVKILLQKIPVNTDYRLENVCICDMDNLKKHEMESLPDFSKIAMSIFSPNTHGTANITYVDDLLGKMVTVGMAVAEKGDYATTYEIYESNEKTSLSVNLINHEKIYGYISFDKETGSGSFYGTNVEQNLLIHITSKTLSETDFISWLKSIDQKSDFTYYPQIRRTMLVFPDKDENNPQDFILFDLSRVGNDYLLSKNYADWAYAIVGHWNSKTYLAQNNKIVNVGFFDMDYDYTASRVHEMFMESNKEDKDVYNPLNHSSNVKNVVSWYVFTLDGSEVSFSTKSYIIAVDSQTLEEKELVNFSESLKIWD